jgi:hypothetical protein
MSHVTPETVANVLAALLAGSEILSLLPGVKANGWVQLILGIMRGAASTKR